MTTPGPSQESPRMTITRRFLDQVLENKMNVADLFVTRPTRFTVPPGVTVYIVGRTAPGEQLVVKES